MTKKKPEKKLAWNWILRAAVALGLGALLAVLFSGCAAAKPQVEAVPRVSPGFGEQVVDEAYLKEAKWREVVAGDTLWDLSAVELGDPFRWPLLWKINRDQVVEPDIIEVGQRLDLPAAIWGQEDTWARGVAARWPKAGYGRRGAPEGPQ